MAGSAFDDYDMRYGFAIDKLFSKRRRQVRECKCGKPLGVGKLDRVHCNDCRKQQAMHRAQSPTGDTRD